MNHQRQNRAFFYFNVFSVSSDSWHLLDQIRQNYLKKIIYSVPTELLQTKFPEGVTFIPQPLANGKIGVEIWDCDLKFNIMSKHVVVCDSCFGKWAFICGIRAPEGISFQDQVKYVLEKMEILLKDVGFEFQDLVRTWFYIGDILRKEGNTVRYDLLNKVRNKFYAKVWGKDKQYPASTGIGMQEKGLIMEGIALKPSHKTNVIRLENPLQKSSFNYRIPEERRPKFCRAIVIENNNKGIIFVSGTASIRGEDICYAGDVEMQTFVTIENIEALIKKDNLKRYGINWDLLLKNTAFMKVYIKEKRYYPIVRNICQQHFGNIPQLYLLADICRPELMVEIEAVVIKT